MNCQFSKVKYIVYSMLIFKEDFSLYLGKLQRWWKSKYNLMQMYSNNYRMKKGQQVRAPSMCKRQMMARQVFLPWEDGFAVFNCSRGREAREYIRQKLFADKQQSFPTIPFSLLPSLSCLFLHPSFPQHISFPLFSPTSLFSLYLFLSLFISQCLFSMSFYPWICFSSLSRLFFFLSFCLFSLYFLVLHPSAFLFLSHQWWVSHQA